MIPAAWICLFLPLAGALAITLAGNTINRRAAGLIGTASVAGAFVAAVWCFVEMLSRDEAERAQSSTAWSWVTAGDLDFGLQIYVDQLAVFMMLIVSGVGALIVGYSIGYMDKVDEERRFFALHGVLRLLHAAAGRGRQPADAARSLGPRRPLVVSPDRLRARAAGGRSPPPRRRSS